MSASLAELMSQGKLRPWPRPGWCPRCGRTRLWGHGFVLRYFDGCADSVPMKRWRCPDCRAVHTCRPADYWRRFLTSIETITASLTAKIAGSRWRSDISRQRQQYWFRGFRIQSLVDGMPGTDLGSLHAAGFIPPTHSLSDRAITSWPGPPYRRLAATDPP
jgi:hypothetical protein